MLIVNIKQERCVLKTKESEEITLAKQALKELVEKFDTSDQQLKEQHTENLPDISYYIKMIEKELIKNDQMKTQSEDIYLKHIKTLQKDCKTMQSKILQCETENKNLTILLKQINNENFQESINELHREIELKNDEINNLKYELDKQHNENENEILKMKKVSLIFNNFYHKILISYNFFIISHKNDKIVIILFELLRKLTRRTKF